METDDDPISRRLLPGERIAWSGRPAQGLLLTAQDAVSIPVSLACCGLAAFLMWRAHGRGGPGSSMVLGALFVCVGFFFVFGRFLVDAWARRRMRYAVTDRRILIHRPPPFGRSTAIPLGRLPEVKLEERADGRGTIRFGPEVAPYSTKNLGAWMPAFDLTPQFIAIADARRVADLVRPSSRDA